MRILIPKQILADSWHLFFRQWRTWFDLAVIPLVWSIIIQLLLQPDLSGIAGLDPKDPAAVKDPVVVKAVMRFMGSMVVLIAASIVVWSMFAAAWMRFCLGLPPASATPAGLSFDSTARGVAIGFIKLMLILMAISAVVFMIVGTGGTTLGAMNSLAMISIVACAPLLLRLSAILPAAAGGTRLTLGAVWRLTRGNGLRLMFALAIAVVGTFFVAELLESIILAALKAAFGQPMTLGPRVLATLLGGLIAYATSAFILAVLALSYRQLDLGPNLQVVQTPRPDR